MMTDEEETMADTPELWMTVPSVESADAHTCCECQTVAEVSLRRVPAGALLIEKSEIGAAIARMVKAADEWVATHRLWVVNDPAYHEMLLRAAAGE